MKVSKNLFYIKSGVINENLNDLTSLSIDKELFKPL